MPRVLDGSDATCYDCRLIVVKIRKKMRRAENRKRNKKMEDQEMEALLKERRVTSLQKRRKQYTKHILSLTIPAYL